MRTGDPLILNLAGTGMESTKALNPHLPVSREEILDDVARALEMGVQMVHLHVRDAQGKHTGDPEPYGRLIEAIRQLPGGRELVVGVTTSGRLDSRYESRARVLELDGAMKPDLASLTLGSLNFLRSASINTPDTIRRLATRMQERGIRPELEVFDLGMANFVRVLLREGVITPPLYINVLLGNIAGAQTTPLELAAILAALPEGALVAVAGLGRFQLTANGLGVLFADGVRIGLEDNLWLDGERKRPASNRELVARVLRLAGEFQRPIMTREAVRQKIVPA